MQVINNCKMLSPLHLLAIVAEYPDSQMEGGPLVLQLPQQLMEKTYKIVIVVLFYNIY